MISDNVIMVADRSQSQSAPPPPSPPPAGTGFTQERNVGPDLDFPKVTSSDFADVRSSLAVLIYALHDLQAVDGHIYESLVSINSLITQCIGIELQWDQRLAASMQNIHSLFQELLKCVDDSRISFSVAIDDAIRACKHGLRAQDQA